jgi:NADPH:quinone reductase-like Zn-dependent oxidoreductase
MKAIVQDRYGPPDVLRIKEIDAPTAGPGQVLARVHAAGLDAGVWHVMAGKPYAVRLMGFGLRAPKNPVRGTEFAGRVEAVGPGVADVRIGDEVFGTADGTFAEYVRARADRIAPKPPSLTFAEAAAVPVSATTALQALRDKAKVRPGQRVLVIGAGGGVGTFAVQLAKSFGAEVTGMCGADKVELVGSLGAARVIDYTREDLGTQENPYDVIVDTAGNRPLADLRRVLAPEGTLVIVGGEGGGPLFGGVTRSLRAQMRSGFTRQKLLGLLARANRADLLVLTELIEAGELRPVIDRTYGLDEVPRAIANWAHGHARGKAVITLAS